jgi:hypothetical protein
VWEIEAGERQCAKKGSLFMVYLGPHYWMGTFFVSNLINEVLKQIILLKIILIVRDALRICVLIIHSLPYI